MWNQNVILAIMTSRISSSLSLPMMYPRTSSLPSHEKRTQAGGGRLAASLTSGSLGHSRTSHHPYGPIMQIEVIFEVLVMRDWPCRQNPEAIYIFGFGLTHMPSARACTVPFSLSITPFAQALRPPFSTLVTQLRIMMVPGVLTGAL